MTDDIEAAVRAAYLLVLTQIDITKQHAPHDIRAVTCDMCDSHLKAVRAAIRHVADVARRDALLEVLGIGPEMPVEWVWWHVDNMLAEAEEAVRRDA